MAKEIELKLDELIYKCDSLGLEPIPTKTRINKLTNEKYHELSKNDCILAIQDYYLESYLSRGISCSGMKWIKENLETPMLSMSFNKLSAEEKESLWESDKYIAEEKGDGVRLLITWNKDDNFVGTFIRELSKFDCLPNNIDLYNGIKLNSEDFIIDGELVPDKTKGNITFEYGETYRDIVYTNIKMGCFQNFLETNPAKLVITDILYYKDTDITGLTYTERQKYLDIVLDNIKESIPNIDRVSTNGTLSKRDFYKSIVNAGGSGVVLRNIDSTYSKDGKRTKASVKVHRESTPILETVPIVKVQEAFVSGANIGADGLVIELIFSAYITNGSTTKQAEIATVSDLPDLLRKNISTVDETGLPILKGSIIGSVALLSFDNMKQGGQLENPKLSQWILDKTVDDCIIYEEMNI